jgi:hypothetical protein
MSLPVPRGLRTPAIVIVGLAVLAAISLAIGRGRIVGLGQTMRIDDFNFTAQKVDRSAPPATVADGSLNLVDYVVTLKIDNHARRVPFRGGPGGVMGYE